MRITPNSTLHILKNVPLDNSYEHTLYFYSYSSQYEYFYSRRSATKTSQSYRRHSDTSLKIDIPFDELFGCNYLMFKNTSYENKWFYCFITDIAYINNEITEVFFQIDVLQTYHFDYTLDSCFIERQHSSTDTPGSNIVPEPLPIGDYEFNSDSIYVPEQMRRLAIIILSTLKPDKTEGLEAKQIGGACTGLNVIAYSLSDFTAAYSWIAEINAAGKSEAIIGVYHAPLDMVSKTAQSQSSPLAVDSSPPIYTVTALKHNYDQRSPWNNWTPKNKKLYTHPFNHLYVYSPVGDNNVYPYERFPTLAKFYLMGNILPPASVQLYPLDYNGVGQGMMNHDEGMTLSGWSQLAYSTDTFKAWMAQTMLPGLVQSAASVGAAAGGGLLGFTGKVGALKSAMSLVDNVTGMVGSGVAEYIKPPKVGGNANGTSIHTALNDLTFIFVNRRIRLEEAKRIDDYFTRFGYAQKNLAVPNRNARSEYTYVKTIGCAVTGEIPADDAKTISQIYDKGITWWKNPNYVGMYHKVTNIPI